MKTREIDMQFFMGTMIGEYHGFLRQLQIMGPLYESRVLPCKCTKSMIACLVEKIKCDLEA